jgi:hypothetical protein
MSENAANPNLLYNVSVTAGDVAAGVPAGIDNETKQNIKYVTAKDLDLMIILTPPSLPIHLNWNGI